MIASPVLKVTMFHFHCNLQYLPRTINIKIRKPATHSPQNRTPTVSTPPNRLRPRRLFQRNQPSLRSTSPKCFIFALPAKPLPTVTWFRNDVVVSNVSVALPSAGTTHVRSELRITGLGRRDVHSELTCQATNNPKTAPLASTLHVDMNCK